MGMFSYALYIVPTAPDEVPLHLDEEDDYIPGLGWTQRLKSEKGYDGDLMINWLVIDVDDIPDGVKKIVIATG